MILLKWAFEFFVTVSLDLETYNVVFTVVSRIKFTSFSFALFSKIHDFEVKIDSNHLKIPKREARTSLSTHIFLNARHGNIDSKLKHLKIPPVKFYFSR